MNIYKRELQIKYKGTIVFTVLMMFLVKISFMKYGSIIKLGGNSINEMMDKLPRIVKAMYGMEGLDVSTLSGYAAVVINFLVLILALHGLFLGISHIGNEVKNKTVDFLFVKPVLKKHILLQKIASGMTIIIVLNLIISSVLFMTLRAEGDIEGMFIIRSIVVLLLADILFYALGILLSTLSNKNSSKYGMIVFFILYFLSILSKLLSNISVLKMISPLDILSGYSIIKDFNMLSFIIVCIMSALMIAFSVFKIERSIPV